MSVPIPNITIITTIIFIIIIIIIVIVIIIIVIIIIVIIIVIIIIILLTISKNGDSCWEVEDDSLDHDHDDGHTIFRVN